jgi:hypothetical protein
MSPIKNVNQRGTGTHFQRASGTHTDGCIGVSDSGFDAVTFVAGFDDIAVMG